MENIKLAVIVADREYGRALGLSLVDVYKNFTVTLYPVSYTHLDVYKRQGLFRTERRSAAFCYPENGAGFEF